MDRRIIRIAALLGAPLLSACPKPVDADGFDGLGFETDGGTTLGTDGGTGVDRPSDDDASVTMTGAPSTADAGDPECGLGASCGEAAPVGWFGPTARARVLGDAAMPDCPAEFPDAGPTVLEGYHDPGPAICDCTCEVQEAQACLSYAYSYADATCSAFSNFQQFSADCHDFAIAGGAYFSIYQQGQPFCQQMKTTELPEVPWDASIRSCKLPDDPLPCGDDGVCMPDAPAGFEAGACIYAEGDLPCPAGPYATKHGYYSGVEDARSCSNCTCGQGTTTCTATMQVFDGANCGGNQVADAPANVCTPATGASVGLNFTGESSCPVATAPEPMGTVAPMGEFTFCCTE